MAVVEKNPKQLVSEYCQREKIAQPQYQCTADGQEGQAKGFFCTLTLGKNTFANYGTLYTYVCL